MTPQNTITGLEAGEREAAWKLANERLVESIKASVGSRARRRQQ